MKVECAVRQLCGTEWSNRFNFIKYPLQHHETVFCVMLWEVFCSDSSCLSFLQLNHQNRSLKRKSMMLLSHLNPDTITKIHFEDEDEEDHGEDLNGASKMCISPQCQTTISGIRQISICSIYNMSHIYQRVVFSTLKDHI